MTKKSLQRRLSRAKKLYVGHAPKKEPVSQKVTRLALGGFMTMAGVSHLAWNRKTFQAQVPSWAPFSEDSVVVGSGLAEIGLGLGLLALPKERRKVGLHWPLFTSLFSRAMWGSTPRRTADLTWILTASAFCVSSGSRV